MEHNWSFIKMDISARVICGFIVFGCCSAYGIKLIYLGVSNQIIDGAGMVKAPRWMFLVGGFLMLIPLIAYIAFLIHQGYFQK